MALLGAREERSWTQRQFLSAADTPQCVVQISLNVPGLPKRMDRDAAAVREARKIFLKDLGITSSFEVSLSNYAGIAHLMFFARIDARHVKKSAISVEEGSEAGRALDVDVITPSGSVSRSDLGITPRKCVICGEEAKVCARARAHPADEVRDVIGRLLIHFSGF
jgi:holo-ACP synthase CitX